MKNLKELHEDKIFMKKLADSFKPYSTSLANAWKTNPDEWGTHCANAVFSLETWFQKPRPTPPDAKKIYLAAAALRKQIAVKMTGNKNYAADRFDSRNAYTQTTLLPTNRYGDQLNEGLNFLAELPPNGPDHEHFHLIFNAHGHPDAYQEINGVMEHLPTEKKQLLYIDGCQHYLHHKGERILLTASRIYVWFIPEKKSSIEFFDVCNVSNYNVDKIFNYLDIEKLDLWNNNTEMTDDLFYEKLSDLMWLLGNACPLQEGSASTSEYIMKWCLIKRFGEEAPLFFKPGLSWDIIAQVTTREQYRKIFPTLLRRTAPEQDEIKKSYNITLTQKAEDLFLQDRLNTLLAKDANDIIQVEKGGIEDLLFTTKDHLTLLAHDGHKIFPQFLQEDLNIDIKQSWSQTHYTKNGL